MKSPISRRQLIRRGAALAASIPFLKAAIAADFDAEQDNLIKVARGLGQKTNTPLRLLYPEGCIDNLTPVIQAFESTTGVRVIAVQGTLDDIGSEVRFNETIKGPDSAFDLAIPATFSVPGLATEGLLTDLTEFAEAHEPAGLNAEMLYTLGDRFDGRFYGYQTDGDVYLMFYNRGLPGYTDRVAAYEDRLGVALEAPKTWQELDQQLAHFHSPEEGVFGGSLYRTKRYVAWEFWSRLHGNGVLPVNADFDPQFEEPGSLSALEQLIAASQSLDPRVGKHGLFDNFESFSDGKKFANIGWGGTQKFLMRDDSRVRDSLTHGLLPGGIDSSGEPFMAPIFNWGWNYVVPRSSTQPELAYLFSLFATLPAMSTLAVRQQGGYFDPHQTSHYDDPEIQSIYGDSFLKAHKESMVKAIPDFHVYSQERYMRFLGEAIFAAVNGRISPKLALQSAASQWRKLTDEIGQDKQRTQWAELSRIYPTRILSATT